MTYEVGKRSSSVGAGRSQTGCGSESDWVEPVMAAWLSQQYRVARAPANLDCWSLLCVKLPTGQACGRIAASCVTSRQQAACGKLEQAPAVQVTDALRAQRPRRFRSLKR